jgi:hypothetical protein
MKSDIELSGQYKTKKLPSLGSFVEIYIGFPI